METLTLGDQYLQIFLKTFYADTQLPESDVDYLAVYQLPTEKILSVLSHEETVDHKNPDFQAHELGKFASLLLKGNPGIIECLFTEHMQFYGPTWYALREIRDMFINQQTLNQYIGYCQGQLQRLDAGVRLHSSGGKYNTKWAYHLIRLAHDARRIAQGHPPVVFKDGEERELLLSIRRGTFTPEQIASMWNDLKIEIQTLRSSSDLPDKADVEQLDTWLWETRQEYMSG